MTPAALASAPLARAPVPLALPSPLAVVCHDAGATNLILPWLDPQRQRIAACVQGPAERLWQERFGPQGLVDSPEQALEGAALLLTGTGWASHLEHRARALARRRGLRSVAVVDHWVNYAARFERDGERVLPDAVWVTDDEALALARSAFPSCDVRQQPNLYLQAQLAQVAPCPDAQRCQDLLVVLEPVRSDWGRGAAGEFQALDYLVAQAGRLGLRQPLRLRLRPHPSDAPGKYDAWMRAQTPHAVQLDDAPTLAAAISRVAWVAGCESMAMVVALAAGRRVVCTLPPWAPECRLPHEGLIHLRHLVT